jgi:hypothetical protein
MGKLTDVLSEIYKSRRPSPFSNIRLSLSHENCYEYDVSDEVARWTNSTEYILWHP